MQKQYLYLLIHINVISIKNIVKKIPKISFTNKYKIYINLGFGYNKYTRLARINPICNIHKNRRKQDFNKYMKLIKYNELYDPLDLSKKNSFLLKEMEIEIIWNNLYNIIDRTYYDSNNIFSNIIKIVKNQHLLNNNINDNKSIVEAICNINFIQHFFSTDVKNTSIVFYTLYKIRHNPIINGINGDNKFALDVPNSNTFYMIKNNKLEKHDGSSILKDKEKDRLSNINVTINNNNVIYYQNLVTTIDSKGQTHFFIIDKNRNIYHWNNFDKNNSNIEKGIFYENKSFSTDEGILDKLFKKVKFNELELIDGLYEGDIQKSQDLTTMYLLCNDINNNFPNKILEIDELIKFTNTNSSIENKLDLKRINDIMHFLIGCNNSKETYLDKGILPLTRIKEVLKYDDNVNKMIQDNKDLQNQVYDFSNFNLNENIDPFNKAFYSLPNFEELNSQAFYINLGIFIIYNKYITSISLDYVFNYKINNEQIYQQKEYSKYIVEIFYGIKIFNNFYICAVGELLFPKIYLFNLICDYSLGCGFIINYIFLFKMFFVYDIYNNILKVKSSLSITNNIYGEEIIENRNFYIEYNNEIIKYDDASSYEYNNYIELTA